MKKLSDYLNNKAFSLAVSTESGVIFQVALTNGTALFIIAVVVCLNYFY